MAAEATGGLQRVAGVAFEDGSWLPNRCIAAFHGFGATVIAHAATTKPLAASAFQFAVGSSPALGPPVYAIEGVPTGVGRVVRHGEGVVVPPASTESFEPVP